jgi:DNA invertase Pin-like site-specific DNA recombinase
MIYAYARLSKDKEGSVSVADQVAKIEAYAKLHDLAITHTFIDSGVSGKTMDRPAMNDLLAVVGKGDKIIVLKLDRLTRRVRDLDSLVSSGVELVSVMEQLDTSTAAGRMMINLLGVFAQWERETIVERTTAALTYRRQAGRVYTGTTPYGWERQGDKLVLVPHQQSVIREIRRKRECGQSLASIAKDLQASGVPSKSGKPWKAHMIQNILEAKING